MHIGINYLAKNGWIKGGNLNFWEWIRRAMYAVWKNWMSSQEIQILSKLSRISKNKQENLMPYERIYARNHFMDMGKVACKHKSCMPQGYESTRRVEFIMFVFRRSRDSRDRPSRASPTGRVLKRPNRPEPAMGPRPSAVFFSSFFPTCLLPR